MPTLSAGLVISTQQTQFGCKDINGTENIGDKHSMKFRTITVTLPVTTAIQSFHKTQDGVPSKFGCKMLNSSEVIVSNLVFYAQSTILVTSGQTEVIVEMIIFW